MYRMVAGDAANQVAQMRRGVLPYCVLAMLRHTEQYGFELVRALGSIDGMVTGEGTIYPLLARLPPAGPGGHHLAGVSRGPAAALLPDHRGRAGRARRLHPGLGAVAGQC